MIDRRLREHFDWALVYTTLLLLGMGLVNLYSATHDPAAGVDRRFVMQCAYAVAGVGLMVLATLVDYRILERLAYPIYGLAVVLLILVKIVGVSKGGSQAWFALGPINFQPIEFAKIALVIVLAKYFHDHPSPSGYRLAELAVPVTLVAVPVGLVAAQPDLGGAMLLLLMMGAILLFVRIDNLTLAVGAGLAALALPLAYFFLFSSYQQDRILAFLHPELDTRGKGYNAWQSKVAIGAGQLFGRGWNNGTQSKLKFLPAHHTDFVFSVLAEEWGFVGSFVVLGFFFLLLYFAIRTSRRSKERFGGILAFGLAAMFFWQIFVNVGGTLGLLPVTGITLPFFSYGGSALLCNFVAVGLLLNIGMRRFMF